MTNQTVDVWISWDKKKAIILGNPKLHFKQPRKYNNSHDGDIEFISGVIGDQTIVLPRSLAHDLNIQRGDCFKFNLVKVDE